MSVLDWLTRNAAERPHSTAWRVCRSGGEQGLTWREFDHASRSWAASLRSAGTAPGDVVMIFLPTSLAVPAAFVGAMSCGAVPTLMPPPSPKQNPEEYWAAHAALLNRLTPPVVVAESDVVERLRSSAMSHAADHPVFLSPDVVSSSHPSPRVDATETSLAFLQHSSGTTGLKKGVALTHAAVRMQIEAYAPAMDLKPDDVIVSWLPFYHDMGLITALLLPLAHGLETVILDPFEWAANPTTLLAAIDRYRGTRCWLPNFAFEHLTRRVPADHGHSLATLRSVVNCSEPCQESTIRRFAQAFAPAGLNPRHIHCTYAMAETVFAVAHTRPGTGPTSLRIDPARARDADTVALEPGPAGMPVLSSGRPLAGVRISIHDADGRALEDGRIGEIAVEAPFLFNGYYRDPDASARCVRDGRFHTRDRGFLWQDEVFVLGRIDDVMIVNGQNFHAHEVEAVVNRIDGVIPGRAVAIDVFDAEAGSRRVVVVAETLAPDRLHVEIRRRAKLSVFEDTGLMIHSCVLVEPGWIVKTTSGKVSREANRRKFSTRASPGNG